MSFLRILWRLLKRGVSSDADQIDCLVALAIACGAASIGAVLAQLVLT